VSIDVEGVDMFSLTEDELKVLIFVFCVALAGVGINHAVKVFIPAKNILCLDEDFGKIDINSADKEQLEKIPGIGKKLAERIIEFREERAGLSDIEQLRGIKGITDARYNKVKNYLAVR
jgi:competence ComEA-like helix-hairpin-helix protein